MPKGGIPLGRFFGISIRLHYSWFIVFALITWALAASYFPSEYPDWSSATYWGIGLATSLLFFLSVLIHELAHSIVAQGAGIPIGSITLFIFGGVSQLTREPEKPGVKFRVALAGPLTSLVIGRCILGDLGGCERVQRTSSGSRFLARMDKRSSRRLQPYPWVSSGRRACPAVYHLVAQWQFAECH